MKKIIYSALFLVCTLLISGCYYRIGELTMISTRNVDSKTDYQLIEKYVKGKAKSNQGNALNIAVDDAVRSVPEGEFLRNVRVYVRQNGRKIKVEGDVWGIPDVDKKVTKSVAENIEFKTGDKVTFRNTLGVITEGTILGLNKDTAIVEFVNAFGKNAKKEVKYEELTQIKK